MTEIEHLLVVIPVHDEEDLLVRCLTSVQVAVEQLRQSRSITVDCVVLLDSCTDRSEQIASRFPVVAVTARAGSVGAARRTAIARATSHLSRSAARRTWIANTDADSVVPPGWLVTQVELAEGGHHVVVGPVSPDPADCPEPLLASWTERHRAAAPGAHVHGCNLGFRLDAYRVAGGFPAIAEHEDVTLVDTMRAAGRSVAAGQRVLTSGRTVGRTPGGFAGYLRNLVPDDDCRPVT